MLAKHRDVDGITAFGMDSETAKTLQLGASENLKRVRLFTADHLSNPATACTPWMVEPFLEAKTVWHPTGI